MDFQDDELKEILEIFRTESEEIIERLNNALLELEKTPDNKDLIILLFRDAHSIKGAARMIGFSQIQTIAHTLEDILGLAKDNKLVLNKHIADIMYKSVDLIAKIINQSIDSGKEIFVASEVQKQMDLLKEIQNTEFVIDAEITNEPQEFDKALFTDKIDRINYLIINSLICIIKMTDKIEHEFVSNLFSNVCELFDYFDKMHSFDIKNELETIKLKLDMILKFNSNLTTQELEEIQQRTDKILTELTKLCKNNDLETIDYYGYAFDGKNYEKGFIEQFQSNDNVQYDFDEIIEKLKLLSVSNEQTENIISDLKKLNEKFNKEKLNSLLNKIIDLLEYSNKVNAILDDSQTEVIINALNYCYTSINGEDTLENIELIEQQVTVVKQLMELSNPLTNTAEPLILNESDKSTAKGVKYFSKLLNSGEIKTLHVDSSKLDAMVNQIGELISAKIKATKQLSELLILGKQFEEAQKDFSNLLNNFKAHENRHISTNTQNSENTSHVYIKQFTNSFSEQNRKLNEIINQYNKQLRFSIENDTKIKNLIDDFDDIIKNIRILPLATVFHMFGRMVRDIANERGKEIEFTINGSETSADKKIIEEIKNPLIHIVRNSIDHGIETPERRKELGKSPIGHLQINAKHTDNKIFIEVKDDGQGFNIQKIKDKAIQKGFLTQEELDNMDDDEIINIVFLPGFTTGDEVTSISGRGIGMDVVKSKIAQLNGTVKVVSVFNKGCSIQIEIPVKVATMSAFLIEVSQQVFAVPMSVINTVICKKEDEIIDNNGSLTILHNNKNIPMFYLSDILDLKRSDENSNFKTIIIMETNNKIMGIAVDKLLGEQKILHKKLSPPIHRLKNISGITTLDSGETCLILNVLDLINNAFFNKIKLNSSEKRMVIDKKSMAKYKKILFVDDSITSRTLGKNVLTNYGFNVETAENPVKAMKLLNKSRYDLIISDIEMPEMTGLEFLSQIKTDELFSDIPFVIMSSLGDDNTKLQAKKLGAVNFIVKSQFNKEIFIKIVSDILLK